MYEGKSESQACHQNKGEEIVAQAFKEASQIKISLANNGDYHRN